MLSGTAPGGDGLGPVREGLVAEPFGRATAAAAALMWLGSGRRDVGWTAARAVATGSLVDWFPRRRSATAIDKLLRLKNPRWCNGELAGSPASGRKAGCRPGARPGRERTSGRDGTSGREVARGREVMTGRPKAM